MTIRLWQNRYITRINRYNSMIIQYLKKILLLQILFKKTVDSTMISGGFAEFGCIILSRLLN